MSLRAYLAIMGFATLLAAATFLLVLFRVDPGTAGSLGILSFYLSLFFAITGILSIGGLVMRIMTHRDEILSRLVALSFRQAVLLAALVAVALALHSRGLLSWWITLLLVAAITVIEFFFISLGKRAA